MHSTPSLTPASNTTSPSSKVKSPRCSSAYVAATPHSGSRLRALSYLAPLIPPHPPLQPPPPPLVPSAPAATLPPLPPMPPLPAPQRRSGALRDTCASLSSPASSLCTCHARSPSTLLLTEVVAAAARTARTRRAWRSRSVCRSAACCTGARTSWRVSSRTVAAGMTADTTSAFGGRLLLLRLLLLKVAAAMVLCPVVVVVDVVAAMGKSI